MVGKLFQKSCQRVNKTKAGGCVLLDAPSHKIDMYNITNRTPNNKHEWQKLGEYYLSLGWSIIPVNSKKKPLIKWKEFQSKKPTTKQVNEWSNNLKVSGYALVTGSISDVVVLDIDEGSQFDTSQLPNTLLSQTGSGGRHYFFKSTKKTVKNAAGFVKNTDFRGEGGYAILPPSKHPSGNQYFWLNGPEETELAEMPKSLIEAINGNQQLKLSVKSNENIYEGVSKSTRNHSATRIAGSLLSRYPQDEWESAAWPLLEGWNSQNTPPLSKTELRAVFESISEREQEQPEQEESGSARPSQAKILVEMVLSSSIKLFTNQFHEPVLTSPETGFLTFKIKSSATKQLLFKMFWDSEGKPPSSEAVNNAITTLQGIATYGREKIIVFNRVGRDKNTIYYDIGDGTHVVIIDKNGWSIESSCPVYFNRFSHQKPQILPKRGGNLEDILAFMNVQDKQQKLLILTFLVVSLIPDIPRAMIVLHGDQGSAKSSLLRILREMIDPSQVPLLTPPDSIRELVQFASHHYTIFLDNLSNLSTPLSDALCRLITGDGFTKRQLFTDDEDVLYAYKRVAGICGINQVATKADLLDRSIIVPLERISDGDRREEKNLWQRFETDKPLILGALFDAVSTTLRTVDNIKLTTKPRMADYFKYATAAAIHLDYTEEDLSSAFNQNVKQQNEEAIDSSPVAQTIIEFMRNKNTQELRSSDLYKELFDISENLKIKRGFPKSPTWLWRKVKDVRPNLMAYGLTVTKEKMEDGTYIRIAKNATNVSSRLVNNTSQSESIGNTDDNNQENMGELVKEALF